MRDLGGEDIAYSKEWMTYVCLREASQTGVCPPLNIQLLFEC